MSVPSFVKIVEVGPRDGLQNEKAVIPAAVKIELIDRLSATGLQTVEAGAFVSPKWVPQMADTAAVFAGIKKAPGVSYPVLVPNERGMEDAVAAGAKDIAVFTAASETFSLKNINCGIEESLARFIPVMVMAEAYKIRVRGYISCVAGCPYEGDVPPAAVAALAARLMDLGCAEISLGDTIGVGTPALTENMLRAVMKNVPASALALHCHDTYGRALANIETGLAMGIGIIDSSVAGLGGCPYAPGASGNVATEAVLGMLHAKGIDTGVDEAKIAETARFIRSRLAPG